jgi:CheY-like chemotaxis protein
MTLLAVEDSRFAAEALRLMCRKLGLRLRRAEDLRTAHLHLRLYRPDAVLIDLGLPDGRGEALIHDLALSPWRPRAVLATSADPNGRRAALAAGADAFIDKPLESFSAFRAAMLAAMPDLAAALPLSLAPDRDQGDMVEPDLLALRDDLAHAAAVLKEAEDPEQRRYLAGFLKGVAAHAHDAALAEAADEGRSVAPLGDLLETRLSAPVEAFRRKGG